jgi:hypothetical protein
VGQAGDGDVLEQHGRNRAAAYRGVRGTRKDTGLTPLTH